MPDGAPGHMFSRVFWAQWAPHSRGSAAAAVNARRLPAPAGEKPVADDPALELERWRHALDNAEDGLWDWSARTGRVYRSARCFTMLGYPPGAVPDSVEAWHDLVHPEDRERQVAAIRDHINGANAGYKVEYRLRRADGSWCWVLDRGKVVERDAEGRSLRVVGTHTEISAYKDLEQKLRQREALLDGAQRVGHIGSWAWDAESGEVWWSSELFHLFGMPESRIAPRWEDQAHLYTPETHARLLPLMRRAARDGKPFEVELEMLRPDGDRRIVELYADVTREEGRIRQVLGAVRDVTEQRRATEAARWRNKLLDRIAAMGRIGGFELDLASMRLQWTAENYRIHRIDPDTPLSFEAIMPYYGEAAQDQLLGVMQRLVDGQSQEESTEVDFRTPDGHRLVLRMKASLELLDGKPWRITGLTQDITEEREAGERIEQLAHFDLLTGLPNRFMFRQRAQEAIRVAERAQLSLCLMFVDLDRFKWVNDTLGHAAGDALLQEIATRLKACLRGSDLISRQGGDEFMVMLCEMRRPEDAIKVAEKIIAAVAEPVALAGTRVQVGCSIGIALLSAATPDLEALMRASDTAMYAAKDAGRNTWQFYDDGVYARVHRRGQLEQELRYAVARHELHLEYQPTVSLADGRVGGIEALLRWRGPDGELRSPMEFIPVAEDCGEIVPIGLWVLDEACRQAAAWDADGLDFTSMAVNVSAVQLRDPHFADRVLDTCARHGWPPQRLVLELTESALMRENEVLLATFARFEAAGIRLAVDDFGTGFSNLLYLHRFPVQQLKIDRSFVSQMLSDLQVGVLTQAIINLGHAMGLVVVAEGVETELSLRALRNQGCDKVQGYHLTRPLPPEALAAWIRARGA
jgi:diguanylate cyclase (GGDEF)-like protein/PAS domain S-box-containing protein